MRRKLCLWLIIVALILSFAGCGIDAENNNNVSVTEKTDASTTKATTEPEFTFEEVVVVDNDECTIKITGIDPSNFWGFTLNVFLENKSSEKTYMFSVLDGIVDGINSDPMFATEVAPGKKANTEISFTDNVLEELGIGFTDIEMIFRVYDYNDWTADPVALETVHIYPYGEDKATKYVREPQETDTVLVDNEYVTAIITGYEPDGMLGYTANIFLVNKTDTTVMFSVDEASVNGYMMDPFWATTVMPGSCKFSSMSWFASDFEENGITDVEEIEFTLSAYNDETFKEYINQVCTLNP